MFMSRPVPAAIGLSAHSGWAALVAVAGSPESPVVLHRRRIEIADRSIPASVQPYHAAQELGLGRAEKFLERCEDAARSLAQHALRKEIGRATSELQSRGHLVSRRLLEKKKEAVQCHTHQLYDL